MRGSNPTLRALNRPEQPVFHPQPKTLDTTDLTVLDLATSGATAYGISSIFTASIPRDELEWIATENLKLPRQAAFDLLDDHALTDWSSVIQTITVPTFVVGDKASFGSAQCVSVGRSRPCIRQPDELTFWPSRRPGMQFGCCQRYSNVVVSSGASNRRAKR